MRLIGLAVVLSVSVLAPLGAEAQQASKVYRIGVLLTSSQAAHANNVEAFRQGLRERGYVEGQNIVIEVPMRVIGLAVALNVSLFLAPLVIEAQPPERMRQVGVLLHATGSEGGSSSFEAGLAHHRVYDLRHTYASLLLADGAPITYVAEQLGHSNSATTLRYYAKWIPSKGKRWVNSLDRTTYRRRGYTSGRRKLEPESGTSEARR